MDYRVHGICSQVCEAANLVSRHKLEIQGLLRGIQLKTCEIDKLGVMKTSLQELMDQEG